MLPIKSALRKPKTNIFSILDLFQIYRTLALTGSNEDACDLRKGSTSMTEEFTTWYWVLPRRHKIFVLLKSSIKLIQISCPNQLLGTDPQHEVFQ